VASTIGGVQDLVVEHGEVEGQTQADGVGGGQLGLSDIGGALREFIMSVDAKHVRNRVGDSYLVSLVGSSRGDLALLARGELGEVAVVVTLPVAKPKSENEKLCKR
jgi:hypothetical protein